MISLLYRWDSRPVLLASFSMEKVDFNISTKFPTGTILYTIFSRRELVCLEKRALKKGVNFVSPEFVV
jgi:hypothetical protein